MNVRRAIARYPLSSSLSMKPPRRNAEYTFSVFKFVVIGLRKVGEGLLCSYS